MRDVELPLDSIRWPESCCSRGSHAFAWRQHTEDVVVWTIISVTQYRKVSLSIPVCARCSQRSLWWFGAAGTLIAAGFAGLGLIDSDSNGLSALCGLFILAGLGLALKATKLKPLHILKMNPDTGLVRLRIRDDDVAERVAVMSDGAVGVPERSKVPMLLGVGLLMLVAMAAITRLVKYLQA